MLQQKSKNIEKAQEIQKVTSSLSFLQHLVYSLFISHHRDPNPGLRGLLADSVTCKALMEKVAFKNCDVSSVMGRDPDC